MSDYQVPDDLHRIACEAYSGRPADVEGHYALAVTRNPWVALRDALAAVLPAHAAFVRAKVAEELREQARIEAERLAPHRPGNDAIENAIVVWEFAANWIDPAIENRPPARIARGDQ